jgi:hypothetical protein
MLQSRFSCIEWIDLSKEMERGARLLEEQFERERQGIRIPTSRQPAAIATTNPTALMAGKPHQERAPAPNPPHIAVYCTTCRAKFFDYPEGLRNHFEQDHPSPDPNENIEAVVDGITFCREAYRQLALGLQGPLAAESTDPEGEFEPLEQYIFHETGPHTWEFCFESGRGTRSFPRGLRGLDLIHTFLLQPNTHLSCPHLESPTAEQNSSQTAHSGSEQAPIQAIDPQTKAAVTTALKGLRGELEEAEHLGKPREEIEEKKETIKKYEDYLSGTTYNGQIKLVEPDLDQSYDRVSKSINRAYERLEPNHPKLASHLRQSIVLGKKTCIYRPTTIPEWVLHPR